MKRGVVTRVLPASVIRRPLSVPDAGRLLICEVGHVGVGSCDQTATCGSGRAADATTFFDSEWVPAETTVDA